MTARRTPDMSSAASVTFALVRTVAQAAVPARRRTAASVGANTLVADDMSASRAATGMCAPAAARTFRITSEPSASLELCAFSSLSIAS